MTAVELANAFQRRLRLSLRVAVEMYQKCARA